MRLTPKQERNLLALHETWGKVFTFPLHLGFGLHSHKLLRRADAEEIRQYYAQHALELIETHRALVAAVEAEDYDKAGDLTNHARYLTSVMAEQQEDVNLYALSDLGHATVTKLLAKRAAADARAQEATR